MARYRVEGEAAFEPLSRAPASSPRVTPPQTVELVLRLRTQLTETGLDAGQLRHIGVGRTHARTHVILLVQDLHVTVVNAATGEILRDLIIDPRKNYQPRSKPKK